MPATLDYNGDRGLRMLDIFERLNKGERISKRDLTVYYGVGDYLLAWSILLLPC